MTSLTCLVRVETNDPDKYVSIYFQVPTSSNKALVLRHLMPSAGTKCNFIYIFLLWVYVHMKKKLYCSNKYLK